MNRYYDKNDHGPQDIELPDIVDITSDAWKADAFDRLHKFGLVRIRLTPEDASLAPDLYDAMDAVWNNRDAALGLEVPKAQFDNLDHRSGYVFGKHRQLFEYHPAGQQIKNVDTEDGRRLVETASKLTAFCEATCNAALKSFAGSGLAHTPVHELLAGKDGGISAPEEIVENMLRVYRYSETYDKPDGDIDAHYDMGLLTIIPKSSSSGLMVQPRKTASWIKIEQYMESDEILMFGGMTLARLTGIPALLHGVFTNEMVRFSAPFFQRVSVDVTLPASPGHGREKVQRYNDRLRDASNDELREDGSIAFRPRRRRKRSPSPKNERRSRSKRPYSRGRKYSPRRPDGKDRSYPRGERQRSRDGASKDDQWQPTGGYYDAPRRRLDSRPRADREHKSQSRASSRRHYDENAQSGNRYDRGKTENEQSRDNGRSYSRSDRSAYRSEYAEKNRSDDRSRQSYYRNSDDRRVQYHYKPESNSSR